MNGKNDTKVKKEVERKNERIGEKNEEEKNETLKGSSSGSGKRMTKRNKKMTEGTSRLSHERQIIPIKQLEKLVKKKTPVFLAVVWEQETRRSMLQ